MPLPVLPILAAALPAAAPVLELPLACTPGRDCFVQNYVDHDPSAAWKDYRCRTMTYDHHTGTDIRIPTLAAMRAGVTVRAALGGRVKNVRDGVADRPYVPGADLHHQECGNGVLVEHDNGWVTQYCHLRQGSVRVKPGQVVAAGQPLGLVGESGEAAFAHLHFEIRHAGQIVDPFADGAAAAACSGGRSLWGPAARAALAYRSPAVINAGFSAGPVGMDQVEAGELARPTASGTVLVAYVRAIGLEAGDVQSLTLTAPDGKVLAANPAAALASAKAQYLLFAGVRRPTSGWAKGGYRAAYVVRRKGQVALSQSWTLGL